MSKKKLSIDDIFNDDEFGILDAKNKTSNVKTEDDRLIDSFEGINQFYDDNGRKPGMTSMSEYSLHSCLNQLKEDEQKIQILKPFDRHNLLGHVETQANSIDDILGDDTFGLLDTDDSLDIFKFKHTPKTEKRADTDFVARRKPLPKKEFAPYEAKFHKVHQELKAGTRKFAEFKDVEKHLKVGQYYIANGLMLFLEEVNYEREGEALSKNTTRRKDGRTRIIFENGTVSNMYYRSLAKAIYNNGKMITNTVKNTENQLFINANLVKKEDIKTGVIYILKSKSNNAQLAEYKNLFKIGFSSSSVDERIKNAAKEATYLFSEVQKVATYACYNRNAHKLEQLLHRFFAEACINIEININNQKIQPKEWFDVPLERIEEVIQLILSEQILEYRYDKANERIVIK